MTDPEQTIAEIQLLGGDEISLPSAHLLSLLKQSYNKSHKPRDREGQNRPGRKYDSVRLTDSTGRRSADGTVYKIAGDRDEFLNAFRLAYQAYLRCGLVRPNPDLMRITPYQMLPTTEVFVATEEDQVVATVSLVRDGELGLPMEAVFGEEVAWRRLQGVHLGEVSCLASRERSLTRSLPVVLQLMSLMAQCAQRRGVNQLIIAVHPKHLKFYQSFTGFEPIGDERPYGPVCDKPAVAMVLDLDRFEHHHPKLHRRFFGTPFPEQTFKCQSMASHWVAEFRAVIKEGGESAGSSTPIVGRSASL
jgi:hypothetical protein